MKIFNDQQCSDILVDDIKFYRDKFEFKVLGYCMMPNHLHLLLWWDAELKPKLNVSSIVQSIKSHSAKEIVNYLKMGKRKLSLSPYSDTASDLPAVCNSKQAGSSQLPVDYQWIEKGDTHTPSENTIWQKSFYDFNIYSDEKLTEKLNYIHYNPVKAGLCKKPGDWIRSSYLFYNGSEHAKLKIDSII
ncbi:transposase [Patescibacteria group bacterium]|nr:transposase [Patescibacteria group bacterium]